MRGRRRQAVYKAHSRLYQYEMETLAYRSLCPAAKAALHEFRILYKGWENRVFMSIRELQRRLNVGRKLAERAIYELLDREFILLIEAGSFARKDRRASIYALANIPLTDRDGDTAPKGYMRWKPKIDGVLQERCRRPSGAPRRARQLSETSPQCFSGTPSAASLVVNGVPQEHTYIVTRRAAPGARAYCVCGGRTHSYREKNGEAKLSYVICETCERCDGWLLKVAGKTVAVGQDARRMFTFASGPVAGDT